MDYPFTIPLPEWCPALPPNSFRPFPQVDANGQRAKGELIAIDGKVLRSSYNRKDRQSTIHMVSAFASANDMVLGQVKTDAKSNEITAIPELLALLDMTGCLISIDAMGCQTEIAAKIVDRDGDYLLAVKGNQEILHRAVREAMSPLVREGSHKATIEQSRRRTALREYHVMPAGEMAKQFPTWKGLNTLGMAIGYRRDSIGNESLEYRYYISSAVLTEERFAQAVRGHWGIENQLHWVLDITMKEDACSIYRGGAAQILATVRHMALNMMRAEKGKTARIMRKQPKNISLIKGVQYKGIISLLTEENKADAFSLYTKHFPIAKIKSLPLWKIEISELKFTNNVLGFGNKTLWYRK
jgi:predicted transposase YbfD/YdcC